MDEVRKILLDAVTRQEISLIRLSRMVGRNDAWLQQFVRRGTPRLLPERERGILADYLGLDPTLLGAPEAARAVPIRRLDVAASAGPGALGDDDRLAGIEHFPPTMLRRLAVAPGGLTLITARGDSMLPTIADGDDILVDTGDRRVGARRAIFVLRLEGVLIVKRLHRAGTELRIESDNPATPPLAAIPLASADIVGRVVWLGRKLA